MLKPLLSALQQKLISKFGLAVLVSAVAFLAPSLQAGEVDNYLANQKGISHPSWIKGYSPAEFIPKLRRQLIDGPTDRERGFAVKNLVNAARDLSKVYQCKAAALELLEKEVFPNLEFTRKVEATSSCSWSNTVIACYGVYKGLEDRAGQERCLTLLEKGSPYRDDKEVAVFLMAHLLAEHGEYTKAINTINKLPATSKWALQRPQTIDQWREK